LRVATDEIHAQINKNSYLKGMFELASGGGCHRILCIAGELGLSFRICLKWRKRFLDLGLEGLLVKSGRVRPLSISPQKRISVVVFASITPPDGSTR